MLHETRSNNVSWRVVVAGDAFADPREGVPGTHAPRSPIFFIFMQFSATNLQNNRLAHPLWELPPSGNPGSATVMCTIKRCQRENFIQFTCQNGHPSSTIVSLRGLPLISTKRDVTIHGNLRIYHHNQWLDRFTRELINTFFRIMSLLLGDFLRFLYHHAGTSMDFEKCDSIKRF